ncbi:MAG: alpha/beta hydrolase, partial [Planctomycetota bacterium]|nr:alpha/beta hydrolase [Planctomycetota bacterium]
SDEVRAGGGGAAVSVAASLPPQTAHAPHDSLTLPPAPSLDRGHLRTEAAQAGDAGRLEALVPAAAPYGCSDPQAPVLLFVPGLGLDGLCFVRQLPLGALATLHMFQTPNAPAAGEEGLGCFARYVEEYILARRLDQRPGGLILCGVSMGGAMSLMIAVRRRVRLRGLILISTFGSCKHLPRLHRVLAPLAWVLPMAFFRRCAWLLSPTVPGHAVSREEARWMATPGIRRPLSYFGRAVGALTRLELVEAAKELRLPVLVVHGMRDGVVPAAAARELQESIPGAALVLIQGARHSAFFMHYDQVNAAIARFVAELKGGRA